MTFDPGPIMWTDPTLPRDQQADYVAKLHAHIDAQAAEIARLRSPAVNDDWHEDTTDVLHCSMPPQVREHIEELRAENARLRAAEVPLSANVGFAVVNQGQIWGNGPEGDWGDHFGYVLPFASADDAEGSVDAEHDVVAALIPLAAWSA